WSKTVKIWSEIAEKRPVHPLNFLKQLAAASRYQLPDEKPNLPMVVFCSREDAMVHPSCSDKLAKHWNLPIFYNSTAGHELALDDPEWVIENLAQNLD
ncbi:MAG: alpha/beta hydrolase, partial [Bdellovibrionales bacterium]|nr:alpha/beta hydrolase [Bdellovibrionales bacterium]NQZ19587.1 alpha/beta hydrolase [Bdellovibrionales bacterium]